MYQCWLIIGLYLSLPIPLSINRTPFVNKGSSVAARKKSRRVGPRDEIPRKSDSYILAGDGSPRLRFVTLKGER